MRSATWRAKLLRALKEIRPIGSTKPIPINVQILAATNRDLEQAVGNGSFRRDLYFRLNVLNLQILPRRERRQDIPLLATHLLERVSRSCGHRYTLSDDAMQVMQAYEDRKSTRLNSSHRCSSYAVFC